ncbi:MAG: hypothetical protein ACK5O1_03845 [Holosporales bacterium]|jgi:hypothetical protein
MSSEKRTLEGRDLVLEVFEPGEWDNVPCYVYEHDDRYFKVMTACAKLRLKTRNLPENEPKYVMIRQEDWVTVFGAEDSPSSPQITEPENAAPVAIVEPVQAPVQIPVPQPILQPAPKPVVPPPVTVVTVETPVIAAPPPPPPPPPLPPPSPEEIYRSRENALMNREDALRVREESVRTREVNLLNDDGEIALLQQTVEAKQADLDSKKKQLGVFQEYLAGEASNLRRQQQILQRLANDIQVVSEKLGGDEG